MDENHAKMITDTGAGGKTKRVSSSGTSDTKNDIMLCPFLEAESQSPLSQRTPPLERRILSLTR
jgi:hypothetical protein